MMRNRLILYFLLWDAVMGSDMVVDPKHGTIIYKDKNVIAYDGHIIIPLYHSLPTTIKASLATLMDENCETHKYIESLMKRTVKTVQDMLPTLARVDTRKELKDLILTNGSLIVDNKIESTASDNIVTKNQQRSGIWRDIISDFRNKTEVTKLVTKAEKSMNAQPNLLRKKRVAPFVVFAGFSLAAAAGWLSFNTYTINKLSSNLEQMDKNQQQIYSQLTETQDYANVINANSLKLVHAVHDITRKIDQVFQKFDCDISNHDAAIELISTWSIIAPNSFIRALNSILINKISVDVLPNTYLRQVLEHYEEFKGTIYEDSPELIYQGGRVSLIKLSSDPPIIESVMYIPRIYKQMLGETYKQVSCSWPIFRPGVGKIWLTTSHPSEVIYTHVGLTQWSLKGCNLIDNYYLCDKSEMLPIEDPCVNRAVGILSANCSVIPSHTIPDVITLNYGVLICPHITRIDIQRKSFLNIPESYSVVLNGSTLITSERGDAVIVKGRQYLLNHYNHAINVSLEPIVHAQHDNLSNVESLIESITFNNHNMTQGPALHQLHHIHHIILYLIILLVFMFLITTVLYNRKVKRVHERTIGYLYDRQAKEVLALEDI